MRCYEPKTITWSLALIGAIVVLLCVASRLTNSAAGHSRVSRVAGTATLSVPRTGLCFRIA